MFAKKLLISAVSGLFGSLVALLAPLLSQESLPILASRSYTVGQSFQYELMHKSGETASDISIFLEINNPIENLEIEFNSWSEPHAVRDQNENSIRIDIDSFRPGGTLWFELQTPGQEISVAFKERIANGKIVSFASLESTRHSIAPYIMSFLGFMFFLSSTLLWYYWNPKKSTMHSSNDKYVATQGDDGRIQVEERATGKTVLVSCSQGATTDEVKAAKFSEDEKEFSWARHYEMKGRYTWIGVWSLANDEPSNAVVMDGHLREIPDSVFKK